MRKLKLATTAVAAVCLSLCLSSCAKSNTVVGAWSEVGGEYGVVFYEDGTYRDTAYNIPLQYTSDSGQTNYFTPAGDLISVEHEWTITGRLRLYIGDEYRELKRVEKVTGAFDWEFAKSFRKRKATDSYSLKSALPLASEIYFGEDNEFWYYISDGTEVIQETRGLVAVANDSRDYVLYFNDGNSLDLLRSSPSSKYMGALPMDNDGTLLVETDYSNPSLGTERGYIIDGVTTLLHSGVSYTFTTDSRCTKRTPTGSTLVYNYFISMEGLVALMPVEGVLDTDYMYYDAEQNQFYRLAYQRDSWYDYVSQLSYVDTSVEEHTKDWTVSASLAAPSDRTKTLPIQYEAAVIPQYSLIPAIEVDYTSQGILQVQEYMSQLQVSEELRREYEDARETEQERLRKQLQEDARERERVKAIMDARVEAEIAGGGSLPVFSDTPSYTQPADDLSWLDAFLASVENQNSYDQDENTSSPVVNTGGDTPPEAPESETSTVPPSEDVEQPDAEVSQYDPAFYIDFVCTCVNCHVQALPVELDTDGVLLVDESVIAPGTYLTIEGYGMVVARASGGYTSGQTAVCFSNIHNAVNRFSSGTYNVYQVVG